MLGQFCACTQLRLAMINAAGFADSLHLPDFLVSHCTSRTCPRRAKSASGFCRISTVILTCWRSLRSSFRRRGTHGDGEPGWAQHWPHQAESGRSAPRLLTQQRQKRKMVDVTGIEPATPRLQSTKLASNNSTWKLLSTNVSNKSGNLLSLKS